MTRYPTVLSEYETLGLVLEGRSIARYGDGEFKLCRGARCVSQRADRTLQRRLREILASQVDDCLVGIPNLHSETPKRTFWAKYEAFASLMSDQVYGSSFISRPDSAPWIDAPVYWGAVESLWRDRNVTLVGGSGKSLQPADLEGALTVDWVQAPRQHAWAEYDQLLEQIGHPTRALLCLGPTATVLAVDLARRGVHAVDLGHIAMFLRKHRRGDPMVVTAEDKSHDKGADDGR